MTGYIADLRKLVGHRTIMQCAASVICVDSRGRVLLGRRTDNHLWGYSGGALEIDEYVEDGAKRELEEEMGLIAEELEFFCINSGPEAHYVYPNGDEVSNVEIIYLESEIEELRYFDADEITMDMISPPIRPVMEKYLREYGPSGK